jgi:phosphoribosylamine--glycine ligase
MNVLILGSGGREHAFAWKISQSPLLTSLHIAPGNPGTAVFGQNHELDSKDHKAVLEFLLQNQIDMVVVGPEIPLVAGIHDAIKTDPRTNKVIVVGPKKEGAQLEGSKDFSKRFMIRNQVPTAAYETFERSTLKAGQDFLETLKPPYVLKCDGLAAGKGVLIIDELKEAQAQLKLILEDGSFGEAGAKVVIEEFLAGTELSVFILTDGKDYLLLPTAKDYKRIGEGDKGLNTGGMGALSPAPVADAAFMMKVKEKVIDRSLAGLQKDGIEFQGFLFIGLMRVGDEPKVIEYNVRMGDPETEAVLPLIESDLLAHFKALGEGKLDVEQMKISSKCATTIMMVSGGYPESYEKGKKIHGLTDIGPESMVFHAGTKEMNGDILTSGGRVLTVTSVDETLSGALAKSYKNLNKLSFENSYYRKDIGYELTNA